MFSLGDLTKLGGGKLPPTEVNVYGDGNVKGSFVSLPDIAAVTVRALSDPKMQNREVRIIANTMTQNELVEMWQKKSGKSVKTVKVSAADMEKNHRDFNRARPGDDAGVDAAASLDVDSRR